MQQEKLSLATSRPCRLILICMALSLYPILLHAGNFKPPVEGGDLNAYGIKSPYSNNVVPGPFGQNPFAGFLPHPSLLGYEFSSNVECTVSPTRNGGNYFTFNPRALEGFDKFELHAQGLGNVGSGQIVFPPDPLITYGGNNALDSPSKGDDADFSLGVGYTLSDDLGIKLQYDYSSTGNDSGSLSINRPYRINFSGSSVRIPESEFDFMFDRHEGAPASGSIMNELGNRLNQDFGSDQGPARIEFGGESSFDNFKLDIKSAYSTGQLKKTDPATSPWLDKLFEHINPIAPAMAAKKPKKTLKIYARIPVTKGYITKFKINRKKKNWHDPASYLEPELALFVARKWVVGDMMYVSIHIPDVSANAGGQK